MNSTDTSNHTTPTSSSGDHNQPGTWLVTLFPLLKYLNTRTLALLMFVGFAFLNTTHGKDAQSDKLAVGVTNTEPRDNGYQGASAAAPLILWQFTARIVHAFRAALNDPSLIEYAKQQGTASPRVCCAEWRCHLFANELLFFDSSKEYLTRSYSLER